MESNSMQEFITNLPKAQLHLHIEGSLSPKTVAKLALRNGCNFFTTPEAVSFSLENRKPGLEGFLSHYNKALTVLRTQNDFYYATYNLLKTLKANNIVYIELFFDPQAHTSRGIPFTTIINGIHKGRKNGEKTFGIKANLIMCANRERSVENALEMLDEAVEHRDKIIGFGLDSGPEDGNPPSKFKEVFARAKEEGYHLTAHNDVDQKDSVQHIWESLNILNVERIDHGINTIDDPKLIDELKNRNICITACPVKRRNDSDPQDVDRIKKLYTLGICVTLNSDDPAQFESGYLNELLISVQQASGYSKADMTRFMINAFEAAWLPREVKDNYVESVKKYASSYEVAL
jgi:adenine deaminase